MICSLALCWPAALAAAGSQPEAGRAGPERTGVPVASAAKGSASAEAAFEFVAFSDGRGRNDGVNEPVMKLLVRHIMEHTAAKFVVFPGDLVSGGALTAGGTRKQFARWRKVMAPLYESPALEGLKVYPGLGNHETHGAGGVAAFLEAFPALPDNGPDDEKGVSYSFDHGNAHFVMLDTTGAGAGDGRKRGGVVRRLDWLRADLASAKARKLKHVFVFGHAPAFPVTPHHIGDSLPRLGYGDDLKSPDLSGVRERDAFWALLREFGVDAYVCGHEHVNAVESVGGVFQVLSGAAGAPLYSFNPCAEGEGEGKKSYKAALPYYRLLGYPYEKGGNCQASPDFWGVRAFGYWVFDVDEGSVTARLWGVEPKEGSSSEVPKGAALRLLRVVKLR